MADLGKAYVQIVPSAEGISGSITEVLSPEAEKAGQSSAKLISSGLSTGMSKAGKMLTAGVSAPLMAIGTASVAAFSEVHTGLENIITKTGASGSALGEMEASMRHIASTVPAGFDTIGNAIGEVNTRFGVTGTELEDLSSRFVKFADLNGTDVSNSIDVVQKAMAAFGMETSETGDMLDILNKVGQNTGANVDSLAQSMVTNSAALHEMGFNASQSAQFLGELEVAGIDSSQMMMGLKKALASAAAEGKPLDQALSEVQDSIVNASDSTEAMTIASELFGSRAGPAIAEACRNGVIDFNDLGRTVEDFGGSVENTFETTLTPLDKFKTSLNTLKAIGAEVGNALLATLTPVIDGVSSALTTALNAWNSLSPGMQQFIVNIGLVVAAIGPALTIGGMIMSLIGTIGGALGTLGTAIMFLLSPMGMVVIAIGLIVAAGVYLRTHWEELGPIITGIWEGIKETASIVWNAIKTFIISPVAATVSFVQTNWNAIKTFLGTAWNAVKTTALTVWNGITTTIGGAITNAKTTVTSVINTIRTTVSTTFNNIKSTATTVWGGIKSAITSPIETAKTTIKGILDKIKGMFPMSIGKIFNLKLPHISVSGGVAPYGIGGMGSLPKFSVSWYRKAYGQPYLFNSATVVPTLNGLKGFGDGVGGEIVYGRNQLMRDIAAASNGGTYTFNIYGAEGQSAKEIAEEVRKIIVKTENRRRTAWA